MGVHVARITHSVSPSLCAIGRVSDLQGDSSPRPGVRDANQRALGRWSNYAVQLRAADRYADGGAPSSSRSGADSFRDGRSGGSPHGSVGRGRSLRFPLPPPMVPRDVRARLLLLARALSVDKNSKRFRGQEGHEPRAARRAGRDGERAAGPRPPRGEPALEARARYEAGWKREFRGERTHGCHSTPRSRDRRGSYRARASWRGGGPVPTRTAMRPARSHSAASGGRTAPTGRIVPGQQGQLCPSTS